MGCGYQKLHDCTPFLVSRIASLLVSVVADDQRGGLSRGCTKNRTRGRAAHRQSAPLSGRDATGSATRRASYSVILNGPEVIGPGRNG
jgi:hypothetical protein